MPMPSLQHSGGRKLNILHWLHSLKPTSTPANLKANEIQYICFSAENAGDDQLWPTPLGPSQLEG